MANLIDLKDFACHCDLLPGLSSFVINHFCYQTSKSLPPLCLARFNWQASKRDNLAKERVANVSLGLVELHVPPGYHSYLFLYLFFGNQNFFMATILQLKVAKMRLSEKKSLER